MTIPVAQFFSHRMAPTGPTPAPSATSRHLAAAAYLDEGFARAAIDELLSDTHRAVVPAYGFDNVFVLRHCLRARRVHLLPDVVYGALFVLGFLAAPGMTLSWVVVYIAVRNWRAGRLSMQGALASGVLALLLPLCCWISPLGFLLSGATDLVVGLVNSGGQSFPSQDTTSSTSSQLIMQILLPPLAALACAVLAAVVGIFKQYAIHRILRTELAPSMARHAPIGAPAHEARLAYIGAAQWGNIAYHGGFNPFLGAGQVLRSWSLAMELKHSDNPVKALFDTRSAHGPGPRTAKSAPARIDPVDLHETIGQRLVSMQGDDLPERERVGDLSIQHYLVANGVRDRGDPLVEPTSLLPYSLASGDAIDAIIRHPQAGMRCYLHVTVRDSGKVVTSGDNHQVLPGESQEIATSAFVYVAVEGGMLYLEYVATFLPQLAERYYLIDRLPAHAAGIAGESLAAGIRNLPRNTVLGPARLIRALRQILGFQRDRANAEASVRGATTYNFGNLTSLRELGAVNDTCRYLQRLDAEKYSKLVERRVTETVFSFLSDHEIDTSEYQTKVTFVQNNGVAISNSTLTSSGVSTTGNVDIKSSPAASSTSQEATS